MTSEYKLKYDPKQFLLFTLALKPKFYDFKKSLIICQPPGLHTWTGAIFVEGWLSASLTSPNSSSSSAYSKRPFLRRDVPRPIKLLDCSLTSVSCSSSSSSSTRVFLRREVPRPKELSEPAFISTRVPRNFEDTVVV